MIKQIIFDFGGVLMDLDYMLTIDALTKLLDFDFKDEEFRLWFLELFKRFEKAEVSEADFISQLQNKSNGQEASDHEIITAWNAMMIRLKKERFLMLKELKSEYGIYLTESP